MVEQRMGGCGVTIAIEADRALLCGLGDDVVGDPVRTEGLSVVTHFYQCIRLCSCGTKPQRSENHHFAMTSSWEPQCHHDIIMRTPRITGKPKFSCSEGP